MKKIVLAGTLFFACLVSFAQSSRERDKADAQASSAQSVYGEIFGNGLLFSANYDFRFAKKQDGLGMRVGLGFFGGSEGGIFTIPIGINDLIGKAPNFFELGVGATYASLTGGDLSLFDNDVSTVLLIPTVGYRYQPLLPGFTGRIYFGPLISPGNGWVFWGGISAGFKIK